VTNKISIEVFRDVEAPDIDPEIAIAGIESVNTHIDSPLEIIDTTRRIRVSKAGSHVIRSSGIRWPTIPSDIALVLTARKLVVTDDHDSIGYSDIYTTGGGFSVVSTFGDGALSPQSTVAHELGHLLKLKYDDTQDSHCPSPECIMYSNIIKREEERRVQKTGLDAWRERMGYQMAEYRTVEVASNDSFCTPCQSQLALRAFYMIARKNGQAIPVEW